MTRSSWATPTLATRWACYVAEVTVDTRTGEAAVVDFHAVQEVGRVIHPAAAAGRSRAGWPRASASRSTSTWCGATG